MEVWATESRTVLDSRRCRTNKRPTSAGRTTWPATRRIGKTLDPGCDAALDAEVSKGTLKYAAGHLAGTVQLDCLTTETFGRAILRGRSISQIYNAVSVTLLA